MPMKIFIGHGNGKSGNSVHHDSAFDAIHRNQMFDFIKYYYCQHYLLN